MGLFLLLFRPNFSIVLFMQLFLEDKTDFDMKWPLKVIHSRSSILQSVSGRQGIAYRNKIVIFYNYT